VAELVDARDSKSRSERNGGSIPSTGTTKLFHICSLCLQQALEPRYNRRSIFHLTVGGDNQCKDLEEELLSFPKAINDDASDSAAYQVEIAQPPGNVVEQQSVAETRRRLTENQSR
jgi:hypothetical protein